MRKSGRKTYKDLKSICKRYGLYPDIFGNYPLSESIPIDCFNKEFDFGKISDFPFNILEQVLMIGQIIHNLISQKVSSKTWNLSLKKDVKDKERNSLINDLVLEWEPIMKEWLDKGLEKAKSDKKFKISNGQVFEVDQNEIEKMKRINKEMDETHLHFISRGYQSNYNNVNYDVHEVPEGIQTC